jgi:hypothetical protein
MLGAPCGSASASESAPQLRGLAEGLVGRLVPVPPRVSIAFTAGALSDLEGIGAAGEIEVGVAWGVYSTGMFQPMHLWRLAVSGRASTLAPETATLALLAGRTVDDLIGYAAEAGLGMRLSDDRAVGPVIRVGPRLRGLGIQLGGWWYPAGDDEVGLSLGITWDALGTQPPPH